MNFKVFGDLWSYLASQKEKSIVMYGMGNGADKILDVCERYGIVVSDFFASDGFVRGHSFHGKTVLSYSQAKEKYGAENMIVLLSFASSLPSVLETIQNVADECELYAPDVDVCGTNLFTKEFFEANKDKIEKARELFCDDASKAVFDNVISYKLSGNIEFLKASQSEKTDVYKNILRTKNYSTIVDAGAYNGDTVRELKEYSPLLKKVFALEPDRRNFRKLSQYAELEADFEVLPLMSAAWSHTDILSYDASGNRNAGLNTGAKKTVEVNAIAIDSLTDGKVDYIKYDVEGAEKEALLGSCQTINNHRPDLLVSAYHRSEDIFELPLLISSIEPSYKLYLRRHPYIPAWDLNILAIYEE